MDAELADEEETVEEMDSDARDDIFENILASLEADGLEEGILALKDWKVAEKKWRAAYVKDPVDTFRRSIGEDMKHQGLFIGAFPRMRRWANEALRDPSRIQKLEDLLIEAGGELTPELNASLEHLESLQLAGAEKLDAAACVIRSMQASIEALANEIGRLTGRKQAVESAMERLRALM